MVLAKIPFFWCDLMVFNLAGRAGEMLCTAVVMAGSLALTTAVVAHAYYLKHQFYPTVVYLTKSSPSMAVSTQLIN